MAITAAMVKELRERTGLGMMDCKKALEEASGDMELAIEELRKKSALKAAKKAGRTTADGLLGLKVADDASKGALVEVNIETDFAAKNEKFVAFVQQVLDTVFDTVKPVSTSCSRESWAVSGKRWCRKSARTSRCAGPRSCRRTAAASPTICMAITRKAPWWNSPAGDAELGRNIAMHVTAINPLVVTADQVPKDVLDKEREIYASQAAESGKPADIVEKMVEGRVRKYLAEVSLVDQPFVKDPDIKVGKLLQNAGSECRGFVRFEVGEGIEVEQADFAAEVAAQVKGSS
jgi:elongation factor Ts